MSVQMTEGASYRTRDGEEVGPAVFDNYCEQYPWIVGGVHYTNEGKFWHDSTGINRKDRRDLIEQIPNPNQRRATR